MSPKKFAQDYLHFSRRERLGLIVMLALIVVLYLLPGFVKRQNELAIYPGSVLSKLIDTALAFDREKPIPHDPHQASYLNPAGNFPNGALFRFDPNSLSAEGWQKLGLRAKTIKTILNYTSKGGRFRRTEDLKKIWGMPAGFYERVKDYVEVKSDKEKESESGIEKKDFKRYERKDISIDVNAADTTAWIALPGIGSKLASRIVNFREKLGGFYSIEQVRETFGLSDSTFQKVKPFLKGGGVVKQININTATKDELKNHPYIRWNLANAIVEYRNQHGNFKNTEELKNIAAIDAASFNRIAPYVQL